MSPFNKVALAAFALLAFASVVLLGSPSKQANAQIGLPPLGDGPTITITKVCVWEGGAMTPAPTGTFDLFLNAELDVDVALGIDGLTLGDLLEELGLVLNGDVDIDANVLIGDIECGEEIEIDLAANANVLALLRVFVLVELLEDLGLNVDFDLALQEELVAGVIGVVDCDVDGFLGLDLNLLPILIGIILNGGMGPALNAEGITAQEVQAAQLPIDVLIILDILADVGLLDDVLDDLLGLIEVECTITNTFDRPDVTINKICTDGSGGATFNLALLQGTTVVAQNTVGCDGFLTTELVPGTYVVREQILGGDAADFVTSIACSNGTTIVGGRTVQITVVQGVDIVCWVVNVFDDEEDGVTPPPPTLPEITIIINNENNNNNTNNNTNTQNQTNTQTNNNNQSQTNNNSQSTNVTSSPVQTANPSMSANPVINVGGAEVAAVSGVAGHHPAAPGGPHGKLMPPNTGDGGLLSQGSESGAGNWELLVAGFVGVAGMLLIGVRHYARKS